MKKYEFTGETMEFEGRLLYRIRAVRDFCDVKTGDVGGWIEKEENLSHEGDCWVSGNAKVYGNARVSGDANVLRYAWASGYANIQSTRDYITFHPIGSENGILTAFRTHKNVMCVRGCFEGTLEEFKEAVRNTHGDSQYGREYMLAIKMIKERFGIEE